MKAAHAISVPAIHSDNIRYITGFTSSVGVYQPITKSSGAGCDVTRSRDDVAYVTAADNRIRTALRRQHAANAGRRTTCEGHARLIANKLIEIVRDKHVPCCYKHRCPAQFMLSLVLILQTLSLLYYGLQPALTASASSVSGHNPPPRT